MQDRVPGLKKEDTCGDEVNKIHIPQQHNNTITGIPQPPKPHNDIIEQ